MFACHRRIALVWGGVLIGVLLGSCVAMAQDHQVLPRFPELVIERGYSDHFRVNSLSARAKIVKDTVDSELIVDLRNVASRPIETSAKVRILYIHGTRSGRVWVDGKERPYDRANPRVALSIEPGQSVQIKVRATQGIQFDLDAGKPRPEPARDEGRKGFSLDGLTNLLGGKPERLGRRYLVGPLVSKWGVFPLETGSASIRIEAPREFTLHAPASEHGDGAWQQTAVGGYRQFFFSGSRGYAGAIVLPEADLAAHLATEGRAANSRSNRPIGREPGGARGTDGTTATASDRSSHLGSADLPDPSPVASASGEVTGVSRNDAGVRSPR